MFVKFLCALIYCLTRCHVLRSWPEVNQIIMLREDRVLWFPINWLPYAHSRETPFNFLFISFPPLLYLIKWGNRNTVGCDRRHTWCPVVYSNLSHSFSALFICVFALDQYIQYLICSCVFREESLKLEVKSGMHRLWLEWNRHCCSCVVCPLNQGLTGHPSYFLSHWPTSHGGHTP